MISSYGDRIGPAKAEQVLLGLDGGGLDDRRGADLVRHEITMGTDGTVTDEDRDGGHRSSRPRFALTQSNCPFVDGALEIPVRAVMRHPDHGQTTRSGAISS